MKKSLIIFTLCATVHNKATTIKPIKIDAPILSKVDGGPFIRMGKLVKLRESVIEMLSKQFKHFSFKELIAMEPQLSHNKRDTILHKLIQQFDITLDEHAEELSLAKRFLDSILQQWSQQRSRNLNLLQLIMKKEFKKGIEDHILITHVKTLTEFDTMLQDLRLFLDDLIWSLPKSYNHHQESTKH